MTSNTDRLHATAPSKGWILIALAFVLVFAMMSVALAQIHSDGAGWSSVPYAPYTVTEEEPYAPYTAGPVVHEVPYAPYTAGPVVNETPYAAYTERPYAPYTAGPVVREVPYAPYTAGPVVREVPYAAYTPADEPYAPYPLPR